MKIPRLCLCLLFLVALSAAEARADTLHITGGTLTVRNITGIVGFDLSGANFRFAGGEEGNTLTPGCSGCASGSLLSASYQTSGLNSVSFSIDGADYSSHGFSVANGLKILGANYVVAETVTVPFTFTGFVIVRGSNGEQLADHTFVGQGTVTIVHSALIGSDGRALYDFRRATYNFSPEPVPEPATLALLATGLAGAGAAARRRRKARREG